MELRYISTEPMNPIPRNDTKQTGQSFRPRCEERPDCRSTMVMSNCLCSGIWGPYDLTIVDKLQLPGDLVPGDYVLGWRWDCEESTHLVQLLRCYYCNLITSKTTG